MSVDQLKSSTGFTRTPLQCGPDDAAFLGFISFAFGTSEEARALADQFAFSGGLIDIHNAGDIPAVPGKFIDWLIVNHWGEAPRTV